MTAKAPLSICFALLSADDRKAAGINAAKYAVASGSHQPRIANGQFTRHENAVAAFNIAVACGVVLS